MEQPVLLPKLQTALSCLYSSAADPSNRHEAHEFLLNFKSSNVRRMVHSRFQSQKDKTPSANNDTQQPSIDEEHAGSVYLSCLALILQSSKNSLHKLHHEHIIFGAQQLKHRCRSIKLVESLDIEAEDGVECGVARLVNAWKEIRTEKSRLLNASADGSNVVDQSNVLGEKSKVILTAWLERYVPMLINRCGGGNIGASTTPGDSFCDGAELLALVLQRHTSSLLSTANGGDGVDEEKQEAQIKGTLIMLTLAVSMYVSAFCDYEEEHQQYQTEQQTQVRTPWANSVLSDLGSALSITALRMRYRPTTDKYATPAPEPSCPPLVDMLVNAVSAIKESAEVYFSQKIQQRQLDSNIQSAIHQAHQHSIQRSIAACIKSLPETVLLPPGQEDSGHRVPSVDRASLRAASMELRHVGTGKGEHDLGTGMDKAWKVIVESERGDGAQQHDASALRLLDCCEAWARYVAVPIHIVEVTVGSLAIEYLHLSRGPALQQVQHKAQAAAFQYLVSINDSASQSIKPDDILTAALGVGASGHKDKKNTNTKKKQSSKSKNRHEKRLGRAIATQDGQDGGAAVAAEEELLARRNAAAVAAAAIFGVSISNASIKEDDWGLRQAATSSATSTHGIVSTVAAAASSVLPHLLFLERGDGEGQMGQKWRAELFTAIMTVIRRMCASTSRDVRALAYEPLMILHRSLNSVPHVTLTIEQIAIDAICECTLALASASGYSDGYFANLLENNDEELEIERNDVRDVARSVCSLDSGDLESLGQQKSPSIQILERILDACYTTMQDSQLPPETAVHILSALAKPLNKLGKKYKEQPTETGCAIMKVSLKSLGNVCNQLNSSFDSHSIAQILPLSRLALMGAASLSPMFASLASRPVSNEAEMELFNVFKSTYLYSLQHAIMSTARIPELMAQSTLDITRYDIKGTMRGPGGEDHVGCIALMRMTQESDVLTRLVFEVYGANLLSDLSTLYQGLKQSELERGVGVDYGVGVCPVSRRMILRIISRLALHQQSHGLLQQLVQAPLDEMKSQKEAQISPEKFFRLAEAGFDLSFFSPELVASLVNKPSGDMQVIFECVIQGYKLLLTSGENATCHQWGRLRGAVHTFLRASLKDSISEYSANVISALVKAEVEASMLQCNQGPSSGSCIFIDAIVGDEMANAGLYLMLIKDCLDRIAKGKDPVDKYTGESRICLAILKDVATVITPLILHISPESSSHVDPRPAIAEAFFLTAQSLVAVCRKHEQIAATLHGDGVEPFLGECLSKAMALIFLKDLGTRKDHAPDIQKGMSLDGPHTLAIFSFISESMLGPSIFAAGGASILSAIQVTQTFGQDGAVILISSILRGVSGAIPPWAVEETPLLFKAIYTAMDNDCDTFIHALGASTKVKAAAPFGGVRSDELLAGRYLDVSDTHIQSFLSQSKKVCSTNEWKRLKVILKSTCGGKKKDSGFNLKPQFTSWECERL